VRNLNVARCCHWRYEWVEALDADVYQVLVEELLKEQAELERRDRR
jgi:hypothetical protein